jgi:hypothetical protein
MKTKTSLSKKISSDPLHNWRGSEQDIMTRLLAERIVASNLDSDQTYRAIKDILSDPNMSDQEYRHVVVHFCMTIKRLPVINRVRVMSLFFGIPVQVNKDTVTIFLKEASRTSS